MKRISSFIVLTYLFFFYSCSESYSKTNIITEKGYVESIGNEQETSGFIFVTTKNRTVANIRLDSTFAKVYDKRILAELHEGDSVYIKYIIEDIADMGLNRVVIYDAAINIGDLTSNDELITNKESDFNRKITPLKKLSHLLLSAVIFLTVLRVFFKLIRKGF